MSYENSKTLEERIAAASDPNTSSVRLLDLAYDRSVQVRLAVARNPSADCFALFKLIDDKHALVVESAFAAFGARHLAKEARKESERESEDDSIHM